MKNVLPLTPVAPLSWNRNELYLFVLCSDEPRSPAERVRYILSDDKANAADAPEIALRGLFCQMDALCHFESGETGWKEAARYATLPRATVMLFPASRCSHVLL